MPSYTFVSTANAFVLRGAVPVFVDVDIKTFNINPFLIEGAITSKTKAIVVITQVYAATWTHIKYIKNIIYQLLRMLHKQFYLSIKTLLLALSAA